MNTKLLPLLAVAAVFILAACDKKTEAPETAAPAFTAAPAKTMPALAAAPAQTMPAAAANPALLSPEKANEKAPEMFKAKITTTKGAMIVEVHRAWSPNGADRFYNLVKIGYYDDTAIFRVIDGFMAQVGMHGDPTVMAKWQNARIADDPIGVQSNKPGFVTFATCGPNCRSTQIFFNFGDNAGLDGQGFTPFGKVVEGTPVLGELHRGYGDSPNQGMIAAQGNAYFKSQFPNLDYIKSARLVP